MVWCRRPRISAVFLAVFALLAGGCGSGVKSGPTPLPVLAGPAVEVPNSSAPIATRNELRQHSAWTILVYMDADNDLEGSAIANLNQMEMIGSTHDVHILVQIDRAPGYDSSNGDWTDVRRFLVTRDANPTLIRSLRLDDPPLGELDMGDWRTLKDFVEWGMNESPSDNYCLVIWDHGTGWQLKTLAVPRHRYIASDETNAGAMNVTDIPKALAGKGLSVLAFDACLMQQIEIAYELEECARYMVGSPSVEPSPGYDYYSWISKLTANTSPKQLCEILVSDYVAAYPLPHKGIAQSALDLSKIGELARAVDGFAVVLIDGTNYSSGLRSVRESTLNYSTADGSPDRGYLDLLDYASRCASIVGTDARPAYAGLSAAAGAAVVAEAHGPDMTGACGVGIYIPRPQAYSAGYASLRFAADTRWDEWLAVLSGR